MTARPNKARGAYTGSKGGGGGGGSVNSVGAIAPILSTGGTDPIISLAGLTTVGTNAQMPISNGTTWHYVLSAGSGAVQRETQLTGGTLNWKTSGTLELGSLSGTGSRFVVADTNGLLSPYGGTVLGGISVTSPLTSTGGTSPTIGLAGLTGVGGANQFAMSNGTTWGYVASTGTQSVVRSDSPVFNTGFVASPTTGSNLFIGNAQSVLYTLGSTNIKVINNGPVVENLTSYITASASNAGNNFRFYKNRGSLASPTFAADGDTVFALTGIGGMNANQAGFLMQCVQDGTASLSNFGKYLQIYGAPSGATTITEWARLYRGAVLIGTTTYAANDLFRAGPARYTGTQVGMFGASPVGQQSVTGATVPNPVLDTDAFITFQQQIYDALKAYGWLVTV